MKKVYVVEASSGSHDGYHTWIHGIYLTEKDAEESRDKLNADWEVKKNIPAPYPVDEDGDLMDENISNTDKNIYHNWWFINHEAKEFNKGVVREYTIGKIYLK